MALFRRIRGRFDLLGVGSAALALAVAIDAWDRKVRFEEERERQRLEHDDLQRRYEREKERAPLVRQLVAQRGGDLARRMHRDESGGAGGSGGSRWRLGGGAKNTSVAEAATAGAAVREWYECIEREADARLERDGATRTVEEEEEEEKRAIRDDGAPAPHDDGGGGDRDGNGQPQPQPQPRPRMMV